MNWAEMKKNVGCRVQLVPIACRLDDYDRELPAIDDDWIIDGCTDTGVNIRNVRTHHTIVLGKDHIHHFTTNPNKTLNGTRYGFLTLHVQVFLQQKRRCWSRPNLQPGEPVKPPSERIVEKWVDFDYPSKSGITKALEAAGYRVAWCLDTKLARKIDLEGWEIVVEPDAQGMPTKYRVDDRPADQTLIKKRMV